MIVYKLNFVNANIRPKSSENPYLYSGNMQLISLKIMITAATKKDT